jgi:hypothetical protein
MHPSTVRKTYLIVSGLVLVLVGAMIVSDPVGAWSGFGIDLTESVSVLNDVQATSATLLVAGALVLAGAFVPSLAFTATVMSVALYGGYALGRALSLIMFGIPADGLVLALVVEAILAAAGLAVLRANRAGSGLQMAA